MPSWYRLGVATEANRYLSPGGEAEACMYCTMPSAEPPWVATSPLLYALFFTIQANVS